MSYASQNNSLQSTLRTIKDLMDAPQRAEFDEILELTEDDLVDEEDEDAFLNERHKTQDTENLLAINEILTQIPHPLVNKTEENGSSAEDAARSIETIKKLIKKVEEPMVGLNNLSKKATTEEIAAEILKPLLKDWVNNNLPSLVEEIVRKEIKKQITWRTRKDD
ncbi:MAG: DUF2497 domain-containing protein [Pseudomonadota bacterium]